jgi:hypothetical protein
MIANMSSRPVLVITGVPDDLANWICSFVRSEFVVSVPDLIVTREAPVVRLPSTMLLSKSGVTVVVLVNVAVLSVPPATMPPDHRAVSDQDVGVVPLTLHVPLWAKTLPGLACRATNAKTAVASGSHPARKEVFLVNVPAMVVTFRGRGKSWFGNRVGRGPVSLVVNSADRWRQATVESGMARARVSSRALRDPCRPTASAVRRQCPHGLQEKPCKNRAEIQARPEKKWKPAIFPRFLRFRL